MIQRLVQVGFIIAHGRHCQRRLLPEIVVVDLGHRDIELVPYPVLQAAEGMSLCLERSAVGNVDLYGTNTNKHCSSTAGIKKIVPEVWSSILQFYGNLIDHKGLDDVTDLDIVEILNANTALISCLNLAYVILEPLE